MAEAMKLFWTIVVLLNAYGINARDGNLPNFITPCDYADKENLQNCVWKQMKHTIPFFTKGIPELDVPTIDPLSLDDIIIDQNSLKIIFKKPKMIGLSKIDITKVVLKVPTTQEADFSINIICDIRVKGNYTADGQVLIIPIKGEGEAIIDLYKFEMSLASKVILVKDNENHNHMKLTTPTYHYEVGSATFQLKNLFDGNKQLADTAHQVANTNWKLLMDDFAPPVVKQISTSIIKSINKFFASVWITKMIRNYPEQV